jgi:hypothetical protein
MLVPNSDYDETFLRAYTVPVEDWDWTTRARSPGYRPAVWLRARHGLFHPEGG